MDVSLEELLSHRFTFGTSDWGLPFAVTRIVRYANDSPLPEGPAATSFQTQYLCGQEIGEPMPSYIVHYTRARRTQRDELLAVEGANEELANFLFEANSCTVQTSAVGLAIRAAKNTGKLHYKGTPIPADAEVCMMRCKVFPRLNVLMVGRGGGAWNYMELKPHVGHNVLCVQGPPTLKPIIVDPSYATVSHGRLVVQDGESVRADYQDLAYHQDRTEEVFVTLLFASVLTLTFAEPGNKAFVFERSAQHRFLTETGFLVALQAYDRAVGGGVLPAFFAYMQLLQSDKRLGVWKDAKGEDSHIWRLAQQLGMRCQGDDAQVRETMCALEEVWASNPIDERREVLRLAEGNAADRQKALVALAKYSGAPIAFAS